MIISYHLESVWWWHVGISVNTKYDECCYGNSGSCYRINLNQQSCISVFDATKMYLDKMMEIWEAVTE